MYHHRYGPSGRLVQSLRHAGVGTAQKMLFLYVCHRSGQSCKCELCKRGRCLADGFSSDSDGAVEMWKLDGDKEPARKTRKLQQQRSTVSTELDSEDDSKNAVLA